MSKFRNNKSIKNQGIHTIFGQHSVKAALQNDKRVRFFIGDVRDKDRLHQALHLIYLIYLYSDY